MAHARPSQTAEKLNDTVAIMALLSMLAVEQASCRSTVARLGTRNAQRTLSVRKINPPAPRTRCQTSGQKGTRAEKALVLLMERHETPVHCWVLAPGAIIGGMPLGNPGPGPLIGPMPMGPGIGLIPIGPRTIPIGPILIGGCIIASAGPTAIEPSTAPVAIVRTIARTNILISPDFSDEPYVFSPSETAEPLPSRLVRFSLYKVRLSRFKLQVLYILSSVQAYKVIGMNYQHGPCDQ